MITKKVSKILSTVLVFVMIAAMLSGCSSKDEASDNEPTKPAATPTQAASTDAEPDEPGEEVSSIISYPIDTDQKLSVWSGVLKPEQSFTDYTHSPFHTGLARNTGIEAEWTFVTAGTNSKEAFNLMMTSDTLPDVIIAWTISDGDAERLIQEGVIRDLTDLLPKYAPNYWAYLQNNEYMDKSFKTDEGHYFGFGNFRETEWAATFVGPVIRKDWLDALGLPIPVTIEDWDTVIKAFKEEYGATFAFAENRMNPGLASGFGAYSNFRAGIYIDDNGKVQLAQTQPEWEAYMAKLNEWYEQDLIDPDTATLDDAGMRTKVLNNNVGISVTAMSQITAWTEDAVNAGTGAQWIGIPYPVPKAGDRAVTIQTEDMVGPVSAVISTDCPEEKVELALRWLDYGFTEEGFLYWNYGDEGVSYTMVDGTPKFTEIITKASEGINAAIQKYIGTSGNGITIQAEDMVKQKNNPAAVEAVDTWIQNQDSQKHLFPAGTTMTVEESNEYANLFTPIDTYIREAGLQFMVGDLPIDEFDSFVANLNNMGLPRVLELKTAAYERFINR